MTRDPIELFDTETVDVILRASPTAAEMTTDIFEVWDGEILFEDVRLYQHLPDRAE